MKLQNLVSRLEKHHKKKIDLTLGRTYSLLKKLGNPQDKLQNIVNVVGTNSKASMAYSLKSILNQAGYKCNLYTSPHLQSYTERFVFNDQEISEDDLQNQRKKSHKNFSNKTYKDYQHENIFDENKKSVKLDENQAFPQFNLNVSNPISWKLMLLIMLMQLLTNIMLVVVLYLK